MSFWDHLDEFRGVLIKMALTLITVGTALFIFMPEIFDKVILWPCESDFPLYRAFASTAGSTSSLLPDFSGEGFSVSLINIQLASQLFVHMSTSLHLALIICFPIVVYQLWCFISPGLYPEERRGAKKAFLFANTMFYLGVTVGYFIVFPLALRFLADYQLSEKIPNTITLDSYMDNFMTITMLMGVVFELPLLAWLLGKIGLLTRGFFARYRRHAIVALLVAAALITPTGDPFTLFAVFIPLYALWEGSAMLVPKSTSRSEVRESAV